MPATLVGSAKYTPVSSLTSRTITLPTGILNGDVIFVQTVTASSAAANEPALSGVSGLTEINDRVFSGHRQNLYIKESAVSGDSGTTLTVATGAALRVAIQIVVYRGATAAPVIDAAVGVNGPASSTTNITSAATSGTAAAAAVEIQFVAGSNPAGVTSFTVPTTLTKVIDTYDAGTAGGNSYAVIGHNLTNLPAGSVAGGDLWTVNSACLLSAITVTLKVATVATSVRPSDVLTGNWVAVGAASRTIALADELDSSYAETTDDNPTGASPMVIAFPEIATGNLTVSIRGKASAASPTITRTVALMQGASTVVASRTTTLTTTMTDFVWTTTSGEAAAITNRADLRVRVTDVTS